MAMLAGPRRKQKVINLRAKNSEWSNDSNKFGQRMLEKMGWSSGKGLGAKENGIVEHVVARYKNDDKGLGFEDKNDQWTKHEDDFNSLLANLSNADDKQEKLHSGVSLEVKSKKSKARVHYHKFTRGKDLTRYSEKDLANIFGKKSLKDEVKPEKPLLQEDESTSEKVFTEKGSMEDYFKSKLANFKSKSMLFNPKKECSEDDPNYAFQGFFTSEEKSEENCSQNKGLSFYSSPNSCANKDETEKLKKKKKKKNKNKDHELTKNSSEIENFSCENTTENLAIEDNATMLEKEPKIKNKSKKKKKLSVGHIQNDVFEETPPKMTKKNKHKIDAAQEPLNDADTVIIAEQNDYVPKKKKRRKNKELVK